MSNLIAPGTFSATGALQIAVGGVGHHFSSGKNFDSNNAVLATVTPPSPLTLASGLPFSPAGELYVIDVGSAALPKQFANGLQRDANGAVVCVEEASATLPTNYSSGLKFDATGALVVNGITSSGFSLSFVGGVLDPRVTFTRLSNASMFDVNGNIVWAPANMLLNSATLNTQSVTTVVGATYVLSAFGNGTVTLSGGGAGTWTGIDSSTRVTLTFTATTTSTTFTVAGSVTSAQLELKGNDSPKAYNVTTGAAYFGPRFEYDPITHVALGMRMEGARTNLLIGTTSYATNWTLTNCSLSTLVADLWGTTLGQTVLDGAVATTSLANTTAATVTASATYTVTAYFKRGNTDWVRLWVTDAATGLIGYQCWVNLNTGAIGSTPGALSTGTYTSSGIAPAGNGWYRVWLTGQIGANTTLTVKTSTASADNSTSNVNAGTYVILNHQVELGAFPSSYVPTYAATASRSAENAFVTLISSWYLDAGGTFTVFGKQPYYSLNPNTRTFEVNDNSGNNLIGSTFSAGGVGQGISIVSGSSNFAPSTANTTASYTTFKVGIAGSAAGKKVCLNGGAVATNATVPPLTGLTKLSIGCNSSGTNNFGGWISALRYYNTVLSDAQLQAATT